VCLASRRKRMSEIDRVAVPSSEESPGWKLPPRQNRVDLVRPTLAALRGTRSSREIQKDLSLHNRQPARITRIISYRWLTTITRNLNFASGGIAARYKHMYIIYIEIYIYICLSFFFLSYHMPTYFFFFLLPMLFVYLIRTIHIEYALCSKHYPLEKHYSFFFSLPFDFRKVLCAMYCGMRSFVCVCVLMWRLFPCAMRSAMNLAKLSRRIGLKGGKKNSRGKDTGCAWPGKCLKRNGCQRRESKNPKTKKKEKRGDCNATTHKILRIHAERTAKGWSLKEEMRVPHLEKRNNTSPPLSVPLSLFLSKSLSLYKERYAFSIRSGDFQGIPAKRIATFFLAFFFFARIKRFDYYELPDVDFEISRHLDATIAIKYFPWRFKGENGPKKGTPLDAEEQWGMCFAFLLAVTKIAEKKKKNCRTHKKIYSS